METRKQYRKIRLLAKAIVYLVYVAVGVLSIEVNLPYIALTFGTFVWLFGVDGIAYCLETLAGHAHQHDKV